MKKFWNHLRGEWFLGSIQLGVPLYAGLGLLVAIVLFKSTVLGFWSFLAIPLAVLLLFVVFYLEWLEEGRPGIILNPFEPQGNTGWFYTYNGSEENLGHEIRDAHRVQGGVHLPPSRTLQYCGYMPEHGFYHFSQCAFNGMPYGEEELIRDFNNRTLVPQGNAPTDIETLRSVVYS